MFGQSQKQKVAALKKAIDTDDFEKISSLMMDGLTPLTPLDKEGKQPAVFYVLSGREDQSVVQILDIMSQHGFDLQLENIQRYDRYRPVHYAVSRELPLLLEYLKTKDASLYLPTSEGQTPLLIALDHCNWDQVRWLLDNTKDGMTNVKSTATALQWALYEGAPDDIVKKIVDIGGFDINASSWKGNALMMAVEKGNDALIDLLLAQPGIDVTVVNKNKKNMLHIAAEQGKIDLIKKLVAAGVSVDARDDAKITPFFEAARQGHFACMKEIEDALKQQDLTPNYEGALFGATWGKKVEVIEYLLDIGTDINAQDENGKTPLMRACASGVFDMVKFYVRNGAALDIIDDGGMTALAHAGTLKDKSIQEYLADCIKYGTGVATQSVRVKKAVAAPVATEDGKYSLPDAQSLMVDMGGGLSMTFNFWTQQVIWRDAQKPMSPATIQNFRDIQRQEAIDEAYQKLKSMGGDAPQPALSRNVNEINRRGKLGMGD